MNESKFRIFGVKKLVAVPTFLAIVWFGLLVGVVFGQEPQFTTDFRFNECNFLNRGNNPFFVLQPHYQLLLEGVENGEDVRLRVTVMPRTRVISVPNIGAVRTRIVQEQHYEGGELVELSKNYFAICEKTNDVVYFGEDVDIFHPDGTVTHEGAWRAGVNGATPGIAMPGTFLLGSRYFQEIAPGVAMDRAEHLAMGLTVNTKAGTFNRCVETRETSPLDPTIMSMKKFCPGVGLVVDAPVELVDYGFDIDDDDLNKLVKDQ